MSVRVCLPPGGRAGGAESVRARLFVRGDSPRPLGGASTPRAGNRPAALPAVTLPPPLTPPARGAWQGERRRRHVTARPGARSLGGRRAGGGREAGRRAGSSSSHTHPEPPRRRLSRGDAGHAGFAPRCRRSAPQPPPPSATPALRVPTEAPALSASPAESKCKGGGGAGRAGPAAGWRCRRRKVYRRCERRGARGGRGWEAASNPGIGSRGGTGSPSGSSCGQGEAGLGARRGSQQGSVRGAWETSCVAAGAGRRREQGKLPLSAAPARAGSAPVWPAAPLGVGAASLAAPSRAGGAPWRGGLGPPARLPLAGGPAGRPPPRAALPPSGAAAPSLPPGRDELGLGYSPRCHRRPRGISRLTKERCTGSRVPPVPRALGRCGAGAGGAPAVAPG